MIWPEHPQNPRLYALYRHIKLLGTPQSDQRIRQMRKKDNTIWWLVILAFLIMLGL